MGYRQKTHYIIDKIQSEKLIEFLYGLISKFYVKWEGGAIDE